MARRVVLDCDGCGGPDAETVGPFDLGDGPKAPDLCESCQDKFGVARLIALAGEYGVSEESAPARPAAMPEKAERTPCPRCDATFAAGRMAAVTHLQRIHGLALNEACHAVPFEGEGQDCEHGCGYYGPKRGMPAHLRWHREQEEAGAA